MVNNKKITVSIASIPKREEALQSTINSLINQVDKINVYLNGYNHIPEFLDRKNIEFMRSQESKDLGDVGKFYWANKIKGYHFTCDDDIIYPSNYIEFMIDKLNQYSGFISLHGAILVEPIISFYRCRIVYHFMHDLKEDKKYCKSIHDKSKAILKEIDKKNIKIRNIVNKNLG